MSILHALLLGAGCAAGMLGVELALNFLARRVRRWRRLRAKEAPSRTLMAAWYAIMDFAYCVTLFFAARNALPAMELAWFLALPYAMVLGNSAVGLARGPRA